PPGGQWCPVAGPRRSSAPGSESSAMSDETAPASLRMPAEWEPHEATWIAWPHHKDDWPGKFDAIPWVYADIVRHLHQSEPVRILVNNAAREKAARRVLEKLPLDWRRIQFVPLPTDRVWTRDYLPTMIHDADGSLLSIKW